MFTGRQILRSLCRDKANWDDPVPDRLRQKWKDGEAASQPGAIDDSEELQGIWVREPPVRGTASLFQSERLRLRSMPFPSSRRQELPSPLHLRHEQFPGDSIETCHYPSPRTNSSPPLRLTEYNIAKRA